MKPIIITSDKFLDSISWFFRVGGITLFPFVIVRSNVRKFTLNHESIHIAQYTETLVIGFYLIYLFDWVYGIFKYRDMRMAYKRIRFEQEAYTHAKNYSYLPGRRLYSWYRFNV